VTTAPDADVLLRLQQGLVRVCESLLPLYADTYLHWIFVASAAALALGVYARRRLGRRRSVSLRGSLRYLLPRSVFLHPSALLDYRFYVVNGLLLRFVQIGELAAALAAPILVADAVRVALESLFGEPPARVAAPGGLARAAFTLAMFAALDFAKFLSHVLFHRVAWLWEFHKVHHAAEVLTPITNARIHPAEYLATLVLEVLAAGVVSAGFGYFYPTGIAELTLLNFGFLQFFYYLFGNLRHSHVPLGFGRALSRVLCSPAMHQVHHSAAPRHRDKNFSFAFSCWDALFGTLYVPAPGERFPIGLGDEHEPRFLSLGALYLRPFQSLRALGRRVPQGAGGASTL
jgi:sterol desaturase/sphingolipid hydroxylase (fatty acid hydroxylase superfamily)